MSWKQKVCFYLTYWRNFYLYDTLQYMSNKNILFVSKALLVGSILIKFLNFKLIYDKTTEPNTNNLYIFEIGPCYKHKHFGLSAPLCLTPLLFWTVFGHFLSADFSCCLVMPKPCFGSWNIIEPSILASLSVVSFPSIPGA